MNEELLIALVRQYPELFDPFDKKYHDELRRNNIWSEIGKIMKESPDTCKARWKRIRDNFRRAKTLRKTKITQGGTKLNKPVKYEDELAFLNPLIGDEEDKSSNTPPIADEDGDQTISPPSTPGSHEGRQGSSRPLKRKKTTGNTATPIRDLLQTYLYKNKHDNSEPTVVDFFTNLGRTVHSFPEDVQIRVKGAVFNIINNAESEVLLRKSVENTAQSSFPVMLLPGTSAMTVQPIMNASSSSGQPNEIYYNSENSQIELVVPKTENFDETQHID